MDLRRKEPVKHILSGDIKLGGRYISVKFFPAFAHTDIIPYWDKSVRRVMSIRRLFPQEMQRRFLISLNFDESIHYSLSEDQGDPRGLKELNPPLNELEEVFVDCGAFHYINEPKPRLRRGPLINPVSALKSYQMRHLRRAKNVKFLVCSPDHIITPQMDDDEAERRKDWTLKTARGFHELIKEENPKVEPVGVVHGRSSEERYSMLEDLLEIGFERIAFGGLVPLAKNEFEVLNQVAGIESRNPDCVPIDSPLGLALSEDCKVHMLGLGSPSWYQWWLRLGVDSFDTSKLQQEGAANGLIWTLSNPQKTLLEVPPNSKEMFSKFATKKIELSLLDGEVPKRFGISGEVSGLDLAQEDGVGKYFLSSTCTSNKCRHGPDAHVQDPRVTGSADHNMARSIINAHVFQKLMDKMDELHLCSKEDQSPSHWSSIPLG